MENFKNILFINYGGIGDEILFLPTVASVKKDNPEAKITLALENRSKSIKNLSDLIDETISVDIKAKGIMKYINILKFIIKARSKKFDCVISSGKSPFVAIILYLTGIKERIGYNSKTGFLLTKTVELNENQYAGRMYHDLAKPIITSEYDNPKIEVKDIFELDEKLKKGEYICIHPGVSKMSLLKNIIKCPKKDFWSDLIKGILNKHKQVVLLGTSDDKDLIEQIIEDNEIKNNPDFFNYYKKTKDIMEMAFLMKNSASVICVDSAPMHVAIAVDAKVFAIFGPTNEIKLAPKKENVTIIKNNINCRPCLWHARRENCEKSECLNVNYNLILDNIN